MKRWICRPAELRDAPALAEIHVSAWRAAYQGLMPAEFLAGLDVKTSQARWEHGLAKHPQVLVVEVHESVVGFCWFGPSRDPEAPSMVGEVIAINLHPGSWRLGLGTALLDEAEDRMRGLGFGEATLWVVHGNVRARRFYEVRGWVADGTEKVDSSLTGSPLHEVRYRLSLR